MNSHIKYNIYPSLLDSYADYLNSEDIWLKYWGNSDAPSVTLENFETKQFQGLIDKINRVPMSREDSEKADRGTAFNEIVDCLILNKKSDKMKIVSDRETLTITAHYNGRDFTFPVGICKEFADRFKGATPQVYCEAILPTQYGNVLLYGYIDELMPLSIHDIKVTGSYESWKFKDKWQRTVYPYCINQSGGKITDFEYNILTIKENKYGNSYKTLTEYYNNSEADNARLTVFVERFIEFITDNNKLIIDKKIFNKKDNELQH